MQLDRMLDRAQRLENRAASLYRGYAAGARTDPRMCALWTAMAREEEDHARSLTGARARLPQLDGPPPDIAGWDAALDEIETRLAVAEQIGGGGRIEQQLVAALDLEMTELEALRLLLLRLSGSPVPLEDSTAHASRLAEEALAQSPDAQVRLHAAMLQARARLRGAP